MAIANLLIKIGADIAELKTGTDKAIATFEKTGAKIDRIGSAIGKSLLTAFSVGAVVSFVNKTFDAASAIHDMALKLGISAEAVQGFKFAAEQAGSTLDDVGTALNKMNLELAQGDKSTVEALNAAGLSFDAIRAMKPEDAFLAITDAIAKIPDPMEQVRVGTALMGRGFSVLLPAIREGFRAVADGARKMSNETAKDLADAQDRWEEFGNTVTIVSAGILANLTSNSKFTAQFQDNVMKHGWKSATEFQKAADTIAAAAGHVGKDINLSIQPVRKSQEETDKLAETLKKAAAASDAHTKAIRSLRDELSGRGAIKAATDMVEALKGLPPVQNLSAEAGRRVNTVIGEALEGYRALGQAAPDSIKKLHLATLAFTLDAIPLTHDYGKALETAGFKILPLINNQERLAKLGGGAWPQMIHDANQYIPIVGTVVKETDQWAESMSVIDSVLRQFSPLLGSFGQDIGVLIGNLKRSHEETTTWAAAVEKASAVASGAMEVWAVTSGHATKSAGALHGAVAGAKAGAAFGPYGAAVGAAAGALIGFVRALDAGRDKVKDFAKSFGGFDDLHKKLGELGAQGEQFWIKLTQGVGKSNPTQAQKVINEITAALNKQANQTAALSGIMEEYGFTWEDLGEKARGAKLAELFDTLFEKTQILKEAGIDYSEILRRQSTDYSELVQAAIRTGSEIPLAMRPVLEELIAMGTLVDANGVAFSDLGDVTFAKTLTQGFDQVTLAIRELTAALTDGVGGALDALGRKVIRIPVKFDVDEIPGGGEVPGFAGGTGGRLLNFGTGRIVELHGREGVFTEQDVERGMDIGDGGGGDIVINHQTILDGRVIDERITKVARKDASRGGLRPRAAHGRSY